MGSVSGRLIRAWRQLPSERRLAALAAVGLFVSLFAPWYQETVIARGVTNLRSLSDSLTGWGAFSFVEAAVLLVAAGVLTLLFVRADGQAFHVPGGDGNVVTAAGGWACLLIIWRMFDKQGTTDHGLYTTTSGIEWGIFLALAVAGLLTYTGTRIRLAHEPEPPLPGESPPGRAAGARQRRERTRKASRATRDGHPPGPADGHPPRSADSHPPKSAEVDIDETWIQAERSRPSAASARSAARQRPRSIAQPAPERPVTAARPDRHPEIADRDRNLAEPPTRRLTPVQPPAGREPDPNDPLTLRLDRRD